MLDTWQQKRVTGGGGDWWRSIRPIFNGIEIISETNEDDLRSKGNTSVLIE